MTKTVSARVNNETHTKLVNICNELGKTMNELLSDWIRSQSDFHDECMKDPDFLKDHHLDAQLEKLERELGIKPKIKVENV